jgi:hypothetical protein
MSFKMQSQLTENNWVKKKMRDLTFMENCSVAQLLLLAVCAWHLEAFVAGRVEA